MNKVYCVWKTEWNQKLNTAHIFTFLQTFIPKSFWFFKAMLNWIVFDKGTFFKEHSGSVVDCLTGDRGATGSSLSSITACVLKQEH